MLRKHAKKHARSLKKSKCDKYDTKQETKTKQAKQGQTERL